MTQGAPTAAGPGFDQEAPRPANLPHGGLIAGRYRIHSKLGEGGMGVVYAGEHVISERRVAIKLLHPQFAADPTIVGRFVNEAKAAAKIGNAHIVEVLDMDKLEDGAFFMALEYLDGRDFDDLIEKEGPQPVGRVAHIVSQTCGALAVAHEKGIVHRDLKPENLFLVTRDGDPDFVKILDFGIAKILETQDQSMTQTGQTIGTPHFMSPEQLQGSKSLDQRADLYALGVILYHALTGRFPFEAETFPLLIMSIFNHPPTPMTVYRQDLPPGIIQIVERLLAKHPDHRFGSALEVKQALEPFLHERSAPRMQSNPLTPAQATLEATSGVQRTSHMGAAPGPFPGTAHGPPGTGGYAAPGTDPAADGSQPGYVAGSGPHVAAPAPSSKLPLVLAAGALLLVVGVAGALVVAFGLSTEASPDTASSQMAPATVEATSPQPPAAAEERVSIQVRTSPEGATLLLDGDRVANPFVSDVPSSRQEHRFEARMEGYTSESRLLSFRYPQQVLIELSAEEPAVEPEEAAPPAAAAPRPRGRRRGGAPVERAAARAEVSAPEPVATPRPPPPPPPADSPPSGGAGSVLKRTRF